MKPNNSTLTLSRLSLDIVFKDPSMLTSTTKEINKYGSSYEYTTKYDNMIYKKYTLILLLKHITLFTKNLISPNSL